MHRDPKAVDQALLQSEGSQGWLGLSELPEKGHHFVGQFVTLLWAPRLGQQARHLCWLPL